MSENQEMTERARIYGMTAQARPEKPERTRPSLNVEALAQALHYLHTDGQPRDLAAWRVPCGWGWHEPGEPSDCAHFAAAILVRLTAKDAERCQRPVEPASVGLDWCSVHGGRWRFGDDRCGLARLTAKDAEPDRLLELQRVLNGIRSDGALMDSLSSEGPWWQPDKTGLPLYDAIMAASRAVDARLTAKDAEPG